MNINVIEEILIKENVLTKETLEMAKDMIKITNKTLIECISILGVCQELDILNIVKKSLNLDIAIMDLESIYNVFNETKIKEFIYNLSSENSLERNQVILNYTKDEVVVLTSNLDNDKYRKETMLWFSKTLNLKTTFIATSHYNLTIVRKKIYENINYKEKINEIMEGENFGNFLDDATIQIVERAVVENASDIYINYNKDRSFSMIFFRIKREKIYKQMFDSKKLEQLLTYILNKANMEAARLGGHQDGGVVVPVLDGRYEINLRINTATTIEGKHLTIRIQNETKRIESLGFEPDDVDFIKNDLLANTKGIALLVGATGSGKTTTMYAMLNEFNPFKKHIITMEDPVEIRRFGLNQIQINNEAGQSFKDSIRACMRQAPDIMLIGEIRDRETAERAIEAANTGHLVLATIHASSVSQIEQRIKELGVENTNNFMENLTCGIYQELKNENNEFYLAYEIVKNNDFNNIKKHRL